MFQAQMADGGLECPQKTDLQDIITAYVGRDLKIRRYLDERCGLPITRDWILSMLLTEGMHEIHDISNRLELNYSTVAETIDSMFWAGLVDKTFGACDGRVAVVSITEEGSTLFSDVDLIIARFTAEIWSHCEKEVKRHAFSEYYRSLDRIAKARKMGDFVRGDSVFVIMCEQIEKEISFISRSSFLNSLQDRVLLGVVRGSDNCPSVLARVLGVKAPSISKSARVLIDRDLLMRSKGPTGREVVLLPTASGEEVASCLERRFRQAIEERLDTRSAFMRGIVSMLVGRLRDMT